MSAMEKLFVQIFEKKRRIIEQAQRQCLFFDQHLASKLLIDGIAPPPWLSNALVSSLTSDPKGNDIFLSLETISFYQRNCLFLLTLTLVFLGLHYGFESL